MTRANTPEVRKMNAAKCSGKGGFTAIEAVIVIAVIGILAVIAIAAFPKITGQARKSADLNNVAVLNEATFTYAIQRNADIGDLFDGRMTDGERMQMLVDEGYLTVTIETKVPGSSIVWDPVEGQWQYEAESP
jgi:prepilin-type N-terminal cleavage/methylation domain-containing protein